MADHDDHDGPSLELPSLRLRRRRIAAQPPLAPRVADDESPANAEANADVNAEAAPARPRRTLPRPSAPVAALLTGAVVGLLGVGSIWLLLRVCGLLTGTSSCGGPGFPLLLVAVLVLGAVGTALLRTLGVEHPGSTSALGIGLLTVAAILFFGDALFSRWMTLVLPLISAAAYTLAHLVTAAADD